jgi:predicted DNA-binding helix-hairpin-helix protein
MTTPVGRHQQVDVPVLPLATKIYRESALQRVYFPGMPLPLADESIPNASEQIT